MENTDKSKRLLKQLLPVIIIGITVILISALMASRPAPPTKPQEEQAWTVSAETATRTTARPQLELLGSIESPYTTQLSAAVNADVIHVPVREGDYVITGQLLVELDDVEAQLNLQQKQANTEELEASIIAENNRYSADLAALKSEQSLLQIAKRSVERQKKLAQSNLTSQELIDNASNKLELQALSVNSRQLTIADHESRLKQLEAKLLRAQAELSSAKLDLSRTKVTAPYNGQITQVTVSPGDRVRLGEPIVELYDSSQIEVRAQIPDRSVSLIRGALKSQEALQATAHIYGEEITFALERLSGRANSGAGGIDGLFKSIDEKQPLTIGNSVKLVLDLPPIKNTITAPISAVYGTNRIYAIKEERLVSINADIVGAYFDEQGNQRLILDTPIPAGTPFITTQLPNAINGLKVNVRGPSS